MPTGVETITRVRKPKVDRLKTPTVEPVPNEDFTSCQEVPRASQEEGRGWVGIGGFDIYCFDEACDVIGTDQVIFRGKTYNVDGEPQRFVKRGRFKAVLIKLKAVT